MPRCALDRTRRRVDGRPYGIEPTVAAAGPLVVVVGCFIMPLIWAIPTGLFTAEMSSMFDENGGYAQRARRTPSCGAGPLGKGLSCGSPRRSATPRDF